MFITNISGKDATDAFEDVGHSLDAKEMMMDYEIGELKIVRTFAYLYFCLLSSFLLL